jgi:prophage antirepressor-like protein
MFRIDLESQCIEANQHKVPIILVGHDRQPWFKANEAAALLGYVNFRKAVTMHVKPHRLQTLQQMLDKGTPTLGMPSKPNQNDLSARYVNESGLYQLTLSSKLDTADKFQDWVVDEVLPAIRKTGSYDAAPSPQADPDPWEQKRVDGIELHKLKNCALQDVLRGCTGHNNPQLYATLNNLVNQVVLNFQCTSGRFKKDRDIPNYMSIPDFLDFHGQVTRCSTEMIFQKYLTDHKHELQNMPTYQVIERLQRLARDMQQSNDRFGIGDLAQKLLDRKTANLRKKRLKLDRQANLITPSMNITDLISASTDED